MRVALLKSRTGRHLTGFGWAVLVSALFAILLATMANLYSFLAPNDPPNGGILVVEGWIHDVALQDAVALYRKGRFSKIACTGGPIETGSYIQPFKSYSEMTAMRLEVLGVPDDDIIVAIADDNTRDRTYQAAAALKETFLARNIEETRLHLVTVGPHARRSRLLFRKALGKDYAIGVSSLDDLAYAPDDWYRCSEGVRSVVGELIAFLYALLLFHP